MCAGRGRGSRFPWVGGRRWGAEASATYQRCRRRAVHKARILTRRTPRTTKKPTFRPVRCPVRISSSDGKSLSKPVLSSSWPCPDYRSRQLPEGKRVQTASLRMTLVLTLFRAKPGSVHLRGSSCSSC
jgi:hypothetical protein